MKTLRYLIIRFHLVFHAFLVDMIGHVTGLEFFYNFLSVGLSYVYNNDDDDENCRLVEK